MTISAKQWARYDELRGRGFRVRQAAKEASIGERTAWRYEGARNTISPSKRDRVDSDPLQPIPVEKLSAEARRALDDFGFFQRRYFGRIATPWQEEAAYRVIELLESPEKEYVVINAPPGSGKSTTFTLDIPAWLTCRNRAIRGCLGTFRNATAKFYLDRLKVHLTSPVPMHPEPELIAHRLAVEAEAALTDDFGVFKPPGRDSIWSQEAIVVAQMGAVSRTQKEPTWTSYGYESGFLGMRFDVIFWDDLVDPTAVRTAEAREKQQRWWNDIAERRLEPRGLLVLQGQRFGPDDLYRFALDKKSSVRNEEGEPEQKYHHIVFKAHYEDRCADLHGKDAPYYPEGCLLDPQRVGWDEIASISEDPLGNFATLYQQEDVDRTQVLVDPLWVVGGTDPESGAVYPGCWDKDRAACELPNGLAGDLLSICTADPSPTKYWSIQWWIVRCAAGQPYERYLMDHERRALDAPGFLDWDNPRQCFVGLMDDWQERSVDLGHPIGRWIVEKNGAQRFLLQYEHVRRWMAKWQVDIIPHNTDRNKSDPEYGVQTLAGIYKYGLVRLPGSQRTHGRLASMKLVEEVTHWPGWKTDDCVMAQWFLEWRLPHLLPSGTLPQFKRPSWIARSDTYSWADQWRKPVRVG